MTEPALDDMANLVKFCRRYPDLVNEQQLRWQIFNRDHNGLQESGAVTKKGGKWYIVTPRYRDWLLESEDCT